ncbi:MAG: hypothetical protein EOP88_18900 [Verrucomicrobiaceae bacterium]|nr:MAG: hypothetical protein EOP88_18900 [Verrucomicrobiaceae bacterium]
MNDQQKIAKIFRILTDCSSADADRASQAVCQTPEAVALLVLACGASTKAAVDGASVGLQMATIQAWPAAIAAGALSGAGMLGARRFCTAVLEQTLDGVRKVDISLLQSHVPN